MHYYEYFQWLCRCRHVDEPKAYKGCDLNRSSVSRWRAALAEGRQIQPSAKAADGISKYFGISVEDVFKMRDGFGLDPENWQWMGQEYCGFRQRHGISIERAVDGEVVTAVQLSDFEEKGIPLLPEQLVVICGLIGEDPNFVFAAWKDFLWPSKDTKKAPARNSGREELTEEGHHIGVLFDRADEKDRMLTHTVLDKYDDSNKIVSINTKKRNPGSMVELDIYDEPAAAGFGNYLDAPQSHREQFPSFMIPKGTSFGIRISGNSMEPSVSDGSTVFVRQTMTVQSGKVGIFILNGASFCKQLIVDREKHEVRLHSFNPSYADIVVTPADTLITVGEVI